MEAVDGNFWDAVAQVSVVLGVGLTLEVRQAAKTWSPAQRTRRLVESGFFVTIGVTLYLLFSSALSRLRGHETAISPAMADVALSLTFFLLAIQPLQLAFNRANPDLVRRLLLRPLAQVARRLPFGLGPRMRNLRANLEEAREVGERVVAKTQIAAEEIFQLTSEIALVDFPLPQEDFDRLAGFVRNYESFDEASQRHFALLAARLDHRRGRLEALCALRSIRADILAAGGAMRLLVAECERDLEELNDIEGVSSADRAYVDAMVSENLTRVGHDYLLNWSLSVDPVPPPRRNTRSQQQ